MLRFPADEVIWRCEAIHPASISTLRRRFAPPPPRQAGRRLEQACLGIQRAVQRLSDRKDAGDRRGPPGPADRGPSDLTLNHTLVLHGMARLPWKCEVSAIFRAQSGFHFTDSALAPADVDGDGLRNGVDFLTGRNHFQAPGYDNLDTRFSKRLTISDRLRIQAILEFFNLLNRANPAAVEQFQNVFSTPLGKPLQYLPGREGEVGLRVEF